MIHRKASNILAGDIVILFENTRLRVKKKTLDHESGRVSIDLPEGSICNVNPNVLMRVPDEGHTKSHHLGEFPLTCSECSHELRHEYEYETAPESEPEPLED